MRSNLCMLSILASGLPLLIQAADTGSLTGTASDQAGVKLNYVIVSLKNAVTNAETFTHSTPQGTFSLANLPVGRYTMNVSAAGFSKAQIENITIQRHQTVAVQLTLSAVESIVVQVPAGEKPANPTEDSKAIIKGEIAGLQSRLALSAEQQAQMQVILSDRQIQIAVARNDQSLAQAERREKMGTIRRAAEAKIRTLLNENQLEEYDEILRERRQLVLQKRESGLPSMAAALTTK